MKTTTSTLKEKKSVNSKIVMLTAYDAPTAQMLDEAGVDIVLVGDSVGNVLLGYENTIPVTMDEMMHHTKAVVRGTRNAMVVADMPFMSYQLNPEQALLNAARFIKDAGAGGVKIEGDINVDAIQKIIDAGIPVMGHLGLTPQLVNQLGGYKIQGKSLDQAKAIYESARVLEKIGIFALVLELVPSMLAKKIASVLSIPVISCGAGPYCDGQVLVINDVLGLSQGPMPKFVKRYADLGSQARAAVMQYVKEVRDGVFPGQENSY